MTRVSQLNLNEETSVDLNFGAAQLRTGEPNSGAYLYSHLTAIKKDISQS
jgi:hypothetical protein